MEGILEQQAGLNPVEIMTDTAGSSDNTLHAGGVVTSSQIGKNS
nr:hypothetical protein [Erwinia sp. JUb26]